MYYPRFTKVIIHHFMSKDLSIPRRNKVNWRYVRDGFMFLTIKLISKHQSTQQFGALLPIELTNEEIRNSKAYKEYYAIATGEATPKPKASAMRTRSGSDTSITPPTAIVTPRPTATATPRLTTAAKGKQTAKAPKAKRNDGDDNEKDERDDDEEGKEDDDDENNDGDAKDDADEDREVGKHDDKDDTKESGDDGEEGESDEHESDEEIQEEERFDPILQTPKDGEDEDMGRGLQGTLEVEDTHVTLTLVKPDGMESIFETTSRIDIQTPTYVAPLSITTPTMTSSTISDRLYEEVQKENDEFLITVDENIKKIIKERVKDQVKAQVSKILPRIKQAVNEQLEDEVLTRSSYSSRTSYAVAADLSEMELKKIFIKKMEGNKSIQRSDAQRNLYKALVDAYESDKIILDTYGETVTLKRRRDDDEDKDEEPSAGPDRGSKRRRKVKSPNQQAFYRKLLTRALAGLQQGPDLDRRRQASLLLQRSLCRLPLRWKSPPIWSLKQTLLAVHGSIKPWISELAKQADTRSSFNELMDTPLDFSNFIMNQLRVDTLTLELLAGPTYDLVKGSCKILIELEYHLEEVYKATTDQLDCVNPEGQQYPHNLLLPLPLIPNNRGRRVIPVVHFINKDLKYLRGGASSRKYTTSVTKTKAADYKHIKWIEDLGRKRQQFYGFAVNRESARDVYSKRRIIAVTKLKIVEWHSYKHLDWITKKHNLTKPDTYWSDLKRKEAYTAYSNPRGFIYQNKDKQNRLIRIDKLHKFSDGTLTDVRTMLDDRLKGIRMQYLPQTIWRRIDKDRAAAMIQAIDKRLKTRKVMRSLERFVGDTVMSDSEDSMVTYTKVTSPSKDLSDIGSLGVNELPMMPQDPYAYVEAVLQAPPSLDYVPGPEHTPSPTYVPKFVSEPVYPKFMPPEDDTLLAEEKPLPVVVLPTADSPGYILEFDLEEDDEDPKEDLTDYLTKRERMMMMMSSPLKTMLMMRRRMRTRTRRKSSTQLQPTLADVPEVTLPPQKRFYIALGLRFKVAPSAKETESFETDESAATPPPDPAYHMTARISILALVPMPAWSDSEIVRLLAMSSPPASPLSPWSSLPPQLPFPPLPSILSPPSPVLSPAPPPSPICSLGYRAAMIRLRAEAASTSHSLPLPLPFILSPTRSDAPSSGTPLLLPILASTSSPPLQLPSASRREDRPEVTLPPRKRLARGLKADYGFVATMDREIMRDPEREVGYGITDSWDEILEALQGAPVNASDLVRGEVMSLRTIVLGQMTEIRKLHAADRRRQIMISELLRADHRRSTEIIELRTALQG
nr:hypothetical protein [Tanacetum cinerariifolium]